MTIITKSAAPRPTLAPLAGLLLFLGLPSLGTAHGIDGIEHTFGATHITAQAGNGQLTVGIAPRGEVTVLSWPSPTYYDQLDYETSNDDDARLQARFGASADDGLFAGLWIEADNSPGHFSWLRDEPWIHEQQYLDEASPVILQRARLDARQLKVTESSFVDPTSDVLHRRVKIERADGSDVRSVRYVLYENLAPTVSKPEELAFESIFNQDANHDFAAYWQPDHQAIVHFAPEGERELLSRLDSLMTADWSDEQNWKDAGLAAIGDLLDQGLGRGVFFALGADRTPDSYQVGREPCADGIGWTWEPQNAFDDAEDGELSGSPLGACHSNGALLWDIDLGEPGTSAEEVFDLFLAVGSTEAEALEKLARARLEGGDSAVERARVDANEWLSPMRLPDSFDGDVQAFATRTLLALRQGTDDESGAIVASIATQPPYHRDWPRDGAFFNLALDIAGDFDEVSRHNLFLASVQNLEPQLALSGVLATPPGAWFMNYYADGLPSTRVLNPFEIDQVGLMLWAFWAHSTFASNDNQRRDVLASTWPAMERAANLMAACVDDQHPATSDAAPDGYPAWWPVFENLQAGIIPDPDARRAAMEAGSWEALRPCLANEDDNPISSVSLYSTHVVRLGLLSAVKAARLLCLDLPQIAYWQERADELAAVALKLYYSEQQDAKSNAWEGRADWLLWPMPLELPASMDPYFSTATDPALARVEVEQWVEAALEAYALQAHSEVAAAVGLENEGAAYENKKTLSLARFWADSGTSHATRREQNAEHIRRMAVDLAVPGTRHVGEVWASIDDDEDGTFDRADQRTAVPHLWTASLTYLSAMAHSHPELFDTLEADFAPVCLEGHDARLQQGVSDCDEGCQDNISGSESRPSRLAALALLMLALTRRSRRRP